MGFWVLLLIGYVIWKCVGSTPASTGKEDREFEDINLSMKDTDDDFNIFN